MSLVKQKWNNSLLDELMEVLKAIFQSELTGVDEDVSS